jgi:membrane-associated HD superfamily phosphohydrolase
MMLMCISIVVLTLPKQSKFRYEYEKNRIWTQKDLISPYNFAVLKTTQEIDNDKLAALASVNPIYQLDENIAKQQEEKYENNFEVKWRSADLEENDKEKYYQAGKQTLEKISGSRF